MKKLLFLLMFTMLLVACGKDKPKEEIQAEKEAQVEEVSVDSEVEEEFEVEEPSAKDKMISDVVELIEDGFAFDSGSYIKGDIPKGEYALITFKGNSEYYVEKDESGKIIDNEHFDSFGYVQVHEAGNIEFGGFLINDEGLEKLDVSGAKKIYEIINEKENFADAGWYKVGKDIDPGKYVIESYGEGYVAVMAGPVGNSKIVDNNNFNGKYAVNIQEGQYLKISRAMIIE
ncbi:hypothetical protein [Lederbergia lenta]|uniref:hypothetical protein n=1 Tax=Lederbergia lenta TaxID=1467 RepID=UPI00203D279C|nr:hypothetical protein [Lederbergia lenta]MCM3111666.1 hypothetical protein [Lederbergia lenta]